ncbi:MAG: thioredoxin domain-containing protein [Saprospirales bacterium]|nr:thioredoxin domain-containing protein [Saprospirales bacterium]
MIIHFTGYWKGVLPLLLLVAFAAACQSGKKEPYTNRLINERSLYLQQHAHNPVDWYPWGEEAFEKARVEGKLLLISIGYSSCHWCHVMEEETFSDTSVARYMNQNFVCIKVDREERPDVDDIYMTACQYASKQGCGWPLNSFATFDGRPVWAGTYFPKKEWGDVLKYFADLYRNEPQKVVQYANELTQAVSDLNIARQGAEAHPLDELTLQTLADKFKEASDKQLGGRKGAPKFPMPNSNAYLLAYYHFSRDTALLKQLYTNLDHMAQGGIYDHLGGGFSRYSTDIFWKVPHFEKMLYDNAQLISLYSQAYRLSHNEEYARVIRQTLEFMKREMTSRDGGFYASQDADSQGEEGTFYVWTVEGCIMR